MVYVVEEPLNVEFDCPFVAVSANEEADSLDGVMRATKWSETVTVWVLLPFVDWFQDAADNILGNAVDDSGDGQRKMHISSIPFRKPSRLPIHFTPFADRPFLFLKSKK